MEKFVSFAIVLLFAIIFLTSCSGEENLEENNNVLRILAPRPPEIVPVIGVPWGSLNIYAEMFLEKHPYVEFIIEYYAEDWQFGSLGESRPTMSQLMALTTRLLADPPDLFIFDPNALVMEKVNVSALFADLNGFIDGPGGLDRDGYFDNIFRAMEQGSSLYTITPYILLDMILLNRYLFSLIGVDADEISSISMGELLDYYRRIAAVYNNPLAPMTLHRSFTFPEILLHEALYNIEDNAVNVNTPEMRERMDTALSMPDNLGSWSVNNLFMPDAWHFGRSQGSNPAGSREAFFENTQHLIYRNIRNVREVRILYLQNHPEMLFTNPVHLINDNGDIRFEAYEESFSIMRQSRNQELAWDFIRFIMEIEDGSWWQGYPPHWHIPVNRARFYDRMEIEGNQGWDSAQRFDQISLFLAEGESSENQVTVAVDFFREAVESVNSQKVFNSPVYLSLIHPDLWLLHTGQQDIYRTLANIQNRLELYVSE